MGSEAYTAGIANNERGGRTEPYPIRHLILARLNRYSEGAEISTAIIIPARGGSVGVPRKNLREVGGISLLGHSVICALEFVRAQQGGDFRILLDTDDPDIAAEGWNWGAEVPFLREQRYAEPDTPTVDSVLRLLERLEAVGPRFESVILLQPTSPLRIWEDVQACWAVFGDSSPSIITVVDTEHPVELALRRHADGRLTWHKDNEPRPSRRQGLKASVFPNGSVYVSTVELLRREHSFIVNGVTLGVVMPSSRSLDIDESYDLQLAESATREPVRPITIGDRTIGDGVTPFVIAEAGVNHCGELRTAHGLIDVAADAGVDAVKFQTFDPSRLVTRSAPKAAYQVANTGTRESQYEMLDALMLKREWHAELMQHAADRGLIFLSSPFDEKSAEFLVNLGMASIKLPSGELTNLLFLDRVSQFGVPLLLSTGMATMTEVGLALNTLRQHRAPVALFHCVSNYPSDARESNLRAMGTMRANFRVPVGWSDHTIGWDVTVASVALGADLIEKHFTLDRSLPGPDHQASLEPEELKTMMIAVRRANEAIGDGVKLPTAKERQLAKTVRKSLYAARALERGTVLTRDDIVALRPANGLSASRALDVLGRPLKRGLQAGEPLPKGDLE